MKIGLYGISRSGKDYLLGKASEAVEQLVHLRGSATLKHLSISLLGKEFSETTEAEKRQLRIAFTEEVRKAEKENKNIFVDGHYSFPAENGGFYEAFTEADRDLYDVFIYLNTKPEQIIENQKRLVLGRVTIQYTVDEIKRWQDFELAEMQKVCQKLGKELFVIDGDIPYCVEFLRDLILMPQNIEPYMVARRIISNNINLLQTADTVILMDCDRTLTNNDTTISFCDAAGIDKNVIKEIYRGDYYSAYQFYKASRIYSELMPDAKYFYSCDIAANEAKCNINLIDDIKAGKQNCVTIGITSGIKDIWDQVKDKIQFPQMMIGKGKSKDSVYVSASVKQALAEELKELGKQVIAIGDSKIDIGMLEAADSGYIVANEKLNTWVTGYFKQNNKTNIRQLAYNLFKYSDLEEADSVWA